MVQFSGAGTSDPDGDQIFYAWDFDANGTVDSAEANPKYTYANNGTYRATLRVYGPHRPQRGGGGARARRQRATGGRVRHADTGDAPFQFGDAVTYEVKVTDDTPVDCTKVTVAFVLGHESHGHPQSSTAGCTGSIQTFVDGGHAGAANLSAVFVRVLHRPGRGHHARPDRSRRGAPGPGEPDTDAHAAGSVGGNGEGAPRARPPS